MVLNVKDKIKKTDKKSVIMLIALIVVAAVIAMAAVSTEKGHDIIYYDFETEVACGIDVSEHNGNIDWQTVKDNTDFAYIRVGYRGYGTGKIVEDKYAKENLNGAKKAGIPFGVYFYSQAVNEKEAKAEAEFVLKQIKKYSPELPVIIDFEYASDEKNLKTGRLYEAFLSKNESTAVINAFCKEVKKEGYAYGVYASSSVLNFDINTDELMKDAVIWAADYGDSVRYDIDYRMWQYSRTGECAGVNSNSVDLNYYYSKTQRG